MCTRALQRVVGEQTVAPKARSRADAHAHVACCRLAIKADGADDTAPQTQTTLQLHSDSQNGTQQGSGCCRSHWQAFHRLAAPPRPSSPPRSCIYDSWQRLNVVDQR